MKKYTVRLEALIEVDVEADSLEQAIAKCDLNDRDLTAGAVLEIYHVVEAEEAEIAELRCVTDGGVLAAGAHHVEHVAQDCRASSAEGGL